MNPKNLTRIVLPQSFKIMYIPLVISGLQRGGAEGYAPLNQKV